MSSEPKAMVVPQEELLDTITQLDQYARTSHHTLSSIFGETADLDYSDADSVHVNLCEFYAGTLRTKEVLIDLLLKEPPPTSAQIPENSMVIRDEDYTLLTSLLTGLLLLERKILAENISLRQH